VLNLRRRVGQSVVICPPGSSEIRVTVVELRPNGDVVVGVQAHPDTEINREEVHKHVLRERRDAKR
jgi:carbon storage regulator CsrA